MNSAFYKPSDMNKTLTILCGIPGAGKSSIANGIKSSLGNCVIASADQYWYALGGGEYKFHAPYLADAHLYCEKKVMLAVEEERHVVIDNTNLRLEDIEKWVNYAPASYDVRLALIKCPVEKAIMYGLHKVPADKYPRMQAMFDALLSKYEGVRSPYQRIAGRYIEVTVIDNKR